MIEGFPKKVEAPPTQETELSLDFTPSQFLSKQLRDDRGGSHYKKLKNILGALALAGLVVLGSNTRGVSADTETEEYKAVYKTGSIDALRRKYPHLADSIIGSLQEEGGVQKSPGSETIFKNESYGKFVRNSVVGYPDPYFQKKEYMLGRKFVRSNPEMAEKYAQRIRQAMRGVVAIENRETKSFASGVIVKTKNGAKIVTNEHAVRNAKKMEVELPCGIRVVANVTRKDSKKDLALLEIAFNYKNEEEAAFFKDQQEKLTADFLRDMGAEALEIDDDPNISPGETIGIIGNPFYYPWETGIGKFESKVFAKAYSPQNDFLGISIAPDERFKNSARFFGHFQYFDGQTPKVGLRTYHKSQIIPGMSGGLTFRLDREGTVKILGLNEWVSVAKDTPVKKKTGKFAKPSQKPQFKDFSVAISAQDLEKFINTEYFAKPKPLQKSQEKPKKKKVPNRRK